MKTSADYWQMLAASPVLRHYQWADSGEILTTLRGLDVTSHADLIQIFPALNLQQRIAAIKLFHILKIRRAGPVLVTAWLSEDGEERWTAKSALQEIRSRRAYKLLISIIESHPDTERREEACYIFSWSFDASLLEPLQCIYANETLPAAVRAQAAEGLGSLLVYVDKRTRCYRQTLPLLLHGLHDVSPEVRFWTCYALGHMRAKHALPELRRIMAEDEALCPDWWYVRDEASDAINIILNKPFPDRERIYTAT